MTRRPAHLLRVVLIPLSLVLAASGAAVQQESGKVPERSEIEQRYKWDLTDMYADSDAWEADFAACRTAIDELAALRGTVGQSPEALLKLLALRDELRVKLERAFAYTMLLRDQDTREPGPQAKFDRITSLAVKLGEATSWFEPEVLALPEGRLMGWCESNPKLAIYTHEFDNLLRRQKHVLSAREEELLAMTGKLAATPRQAFTMLTNADMTFPTIKDDQGNNVELSEGRYSFYMKSPDRALRERAFKGVLQAYLAYKNTIAATLAGSVQGDVFRARARGYDGTLHTALDPDNVPVEVYHNLVATIRQHLPKLHRYMEIRRRTLGIDRVHIYDTFVPLIEGQAPQIGYDDAVATIVTGLAPLGPEYVEPMTKGFQSRWINVHETQGKRSGAYSMGTYSAHPYILLNYNDTYTEMFTTAHEMGHSMHTWFTQHNQPPVYGDYPIFLAEVAATCNEIILGDYLRKHAKDDAERLFLVHEALEAIRGTVINQTMWGEYERLIHEEAEKGAPLTYETMSTIYRRLVQEYFGPAWGHDQEVDGYWLRIPHFYRGFYVYKYATSYCALVALARRVLSGDPAKLEAYLGFLKAGSSGYPIEIIRKAGVDMSTPAPIHATMELFGELLDEIEVLLKKP